VLVGRLGRVHFLQHTVDVKIGVLLQFVANGGHMNMLVGEGFLVNVVVVIVDAAAVGVRVERVVAWKGGYLAGSYRVERCGSCRRR